MRQGSMLSGQLAGRAGARAGAMSLTPPGRTSETNETNDGDALVRLFDELLIRPVRPGRKR